MLVPATATGRCSILLAVDPILGAQAHRDVARSRPPGPPSRPPRLRQTPPARPARHQLIEMPELRWPIRDRARCGVRPCGSCSERPTSTAPGMPAHLLHERVGDLHETARILAVELDLHRFLRTVVQIVEHDVFGPDQLLEQHAQCGRDFDRGSAAVPALADVHVDAAAARVHAGVGGHGLGHRARELRCLLDLAAGVLETGARWGAHFDRDHAVVRLRQEFAPADGGLQRQGQCQA